jgi:hypothetical protein
MYRQQIIKIVEPRAKAGRRRGASKINLPRRAFFFIFPYVIEFFAFPLLDTWARWPCTVQPDHPENTKPREVTNNKANPPKHPKPRKVQNHQAHRPFFLPNYEKGLMKPEPKGIRPKVRTTNRPKVRTPDGPKA